MRTPQAPLHSGFNEHTIPAEVLASRDLRGAQAIVTGGHAGIGLETTRALAAAGAAVLVGARDVEAARRAVNGLPGVEVDALDLSQPASVDAFATRFVSSRRPLHVLINNAGVMACPLQRDARGFESQFATNHLGHFQLTLDLWPSLKAAGSARVVALSSRGHVRAGVDFDDLHFARRPYDKWVAYGQSKTANALFAVALDARGEAHGVRAFAVHPGAVTTALTRSLGTEELDALRRGIAAAHPEARYKTVEQGATTSVWCATHPQLANRGGVYCEDGDIAVAVDAKATSLSGVRPWAIDSEAAERLWGVSEQATGTRLRA